MGEPFYDFNSIFAQENPAFIQIDAKLRGKIIAKPVKIFLNVTPFTQILEGKNI